MKLTKFLTDHNDEILMEWDKFAKQKAPAGSDQSFLALRDHAQELLTAIVKDIKTTQSEKQQLKKSRGERPDNQNLDNAATIHGALRHESGFTLSVVMAEFRALRATVLRLWLPQVKEMTEEFNYDMLRFNEAIDEVMSQSIDTFSERTTRTRDTFLAVLGHDLRNPLHVMAMTGEVLKKTKNWSDTIPKSGSRIATSSASMGLMVNDLLEYGRTQLGGNLVIKRHVVDMQRICQVILDEARAAYPECDFVLQPSGNLTGPFDEARLQQVFANLLNNAARYSEPDKPITMTVTGKADVIAVTVHNVGPVIPAQSLEAIFEPLVQLVKETEHSKSSTHSVGLGLYIARKITEAHLGTIKAESSKLSGTVFTVLLPRKREVENQNPKA